MIKIISVKDFEGPNLGQAKKPNFVYIREDLPYWAWLSTAVHELYHLHDSSEVRVWREVKAILAQMFIPFLGAIWIIWKTLTSSERLKFYWKRYVRKDV